MSIPDSPFSKEQQKLLNAFKQQISQPQPAKVPQAAAIQAQPEATVTVDDEHALFKQALQGVTALQQHNMAVIEKPKRVKPDAKILAKRASAEGPMATEQTELSDTQAMLNPVASQAKLSYRIGTLQHKVFEDLKAGNIRWFEAVDLHGCTIEDARQAVLQIIQIAKDENQNVLKIVHGKGPEAILKTYVNGWLRQHRDVLAFVSAPENQGGTGAVLVLIKRAEKNPKFRTEDQR